jgi:glycosyltransferase involved in cell wall biosynthesis
VLAVVPALNEEATVGRVVGELIAAGYPALVIDDGSSDWTATRAVEAGATVLRLPVNVGVGGALRCGFRYAVDHGYDVVVQCDADGQHRANEIIKLLAVMDDDDADLVVGSRFAAGGEFSSSTVRRVGMKFLTALASRHAAVPLTDATSGFRAVRRPLLDEFAASYPSEYLGDTVEALILAGRSGYRIGEVAVGMDPRETGESTASPSAAAWYTIRVAAAVLLRGGHRRPSRAAHRGWFYGAAGELSPASDGSPREGFDGGQGAAGRFDLPHPRPHRRAPGAEPSRVGDVYTAPAREELRRLAEDTADSSERRDAVLPVTPN